MDSGFPAAPGAPAQDPDLFCWESPENSRDSSDQSAFRNGSAVESAPVEMQASSWQFGAPLPPMLAGNSRFASPNMQGSIVINNLVSSHQPKMSADSAQTSPPLLKALVSADQGILHSTLHSHSTSADSHTNHLSTNRQLPLCDSILPPAPGTAVGDDDDNPTLQLHDLRLKIAAKLVLVGRDKVSNGVYDSCAAPPPDLSIADQIKYLKIAESSASQQSGPAMPKSAWQIGRGWRG